MRWVAALLLTCAVIGCGASTKQVAAISTLAPADAYTCAMRELATRKFVVQNTDRASGFVKAERSVGGLFSGDYVDEITVTVLPATSGAGSDFRVAAQRARVSSNGARSTGGMVAPKSLRSEADAIGAACSAAK